MVKERVLDLANHINRTKRGSKSEVRPEDPEYKILEPVVSEEMAEVGIHLEFRKPQTAEEISKLCNKSIEETTKLLWDLAVTGVCFINEVDGVDKYWIDTWVPGVMEMIVNNRDIVKKHPEVAMAFEEYGRTRGPKTVGNFPVGKGLMRVIPIEESIKAETRKASYEEVSKYLNESEVFSVSDCACRTAREVMGEGCGHLKEDMCIQLGHAAEYYIRTGRGRKITREEAFEIIKRAEENGLVHQIPNTEGPGITHAICNCCGCSCLSLRTAEMYSNTDMVRSNYVARVDKDKCVACGECVENCQVNALKLGQKLCIDIPIKEIEREVPRDTEWGPDKWNVDYRTNRKVVMDSGTSPCKAECPAHIGIQGYIKLASQGRYTEALELIKHENPFPAVCGRICPRKCESACTRGSIDEPVAIDDIKKFIAQQDLNKDVRYMPKIKGNYDKKIAVIGGGPTGLSCAYYLAIEGYKVTVFERQKSLGGMLKFGIPAFRLEKDVVDAEIDILKELGVTFRCGVDIGKDISINYLRKEGFEAFYLAIGAQKGRNLGIEGEDSEGVITGVEFLRKVSLGEDLKMQGDVIVIGGGNVAIDVARTATRVDKSKINMFCLESRDEMPALNEEIEEAMEEGISINNSWGPKCILSENGKVTGVEFKKCISVFDENGRFSPKFDENETKIVKADNVIISVGQAMDWGNLLDGTKIKLNGNKTVKVDSVTLQTDEADIFAGGDVVTGPKFAIDAIALGKEGAISIHRFVHNGQSLVIGRTKRDYRALDKERVNLDGYDNMPRQKADCVDYSEKAPFKDTRGTFTEEQIKKETERCLGCGATVVDQYQCVGCGVCTTKCKYDAIKLERVYDEASVDFSELKPIIIKHALKRKVKIAVKKPVRKLKHIFAGEN